jgi:hypothetical protein
MKNFLILFAILTSLSLQAQLGKHHFEIKGKYGRSVTGLFASDDKKYYQELFRVNANEKRTLIYNLDTVVIAVIIDRKDAFITRDSASLWAKDEMPGFTPQKFNSDNSAYMMYDSMRDYLVFLEKPITGSKMLVMTNDPKYIKEFAGDVVTWKREED